MVYTTLQRRDDVSKLINDVNPEEVTLSRLPALHPLYLSSCEKDRLALVDVVSDLEKKRIAQNADCLLNRPTLSNHGLIYWNHKLPLT